MTTLPESPATPDPLNSGAFPSASQTALLSDPVAALGASSSDYDKLSDEQVLSGQALIADSRRALDTRAAWMAAASGSHANRDGTGRAGT